MRQLSGFDALFVYDDGPRETQHTIKVCFLSEEASRAYDFESAKAHVGTRLVMMPPLRWHAAAPLSVCSSMPCSPSRPSPKSPRGSNGPSPKRCRPCNRGPAG